MKPIVYVETIPSSLTAAPRRDLIVAANQQITHDWWRTAADRFELVVSAAVLDEICRGDPAMAAKRVSAVAALPVLPPTADVVRIENVYRRRLGLNGPAARDLIHLAYAVAYDADIPGDVELQAYRRRLRHPPIVDPEPGAWPEDAADRDAPSSGRGRPGGDRR